MDPPTFNSHRPFGAFDASSNSAPNSASLQSAARPKFKPHFQLPTVCVSASDLSDASTFGAPHALNAFASPSSPSLIPSAPSQLMCALPLATESSSGAQMSHIYVDTRTNAQPLPPNSDASDAVGHQYASAMHAWRVASGGAMSALSSASLLHEHWLDGRRHARNSSSSSDSGVVYQLSPPGGQPPYSGAASHSSPSALSVLSISPPGLSPLQIGGDSAFSTPTPSSANNSRLRTRFTFDPLPFAHYASAGSVAANNATTAGGAVKSTYTPGAHFSFAAPHYASTSAVTISANAAATDAAPVTSAETSGSVIVSSAVDSAFQLPTTSYGNLAEVLKRIRPSYSSSVLSTEHFECGVRQPTTAPITTSAMESSDENCGSSLRHRVPAAQMTPNSQKSSVFRSESLPAVRNSAPGGGGGNGTAAKHNAVDIATEQLLSYNANFLHCHPRQLTAIVAPRLPVSRTCSAQIAPPSRPFRITSGDGALSCASLTAVADVTFAPVAESGAYSPFFGAPSAPKRSPAEFERELAAVRALMQSDGGAPGSAATPKSALAADGTIFNFETTALLPPPPSSLINLHRLGQPRAPSCEQMSPKNSSPPSLAPPTASLFLPYASAHAASVTDGPVKRPAPPPPPTTTTITALTSACQISQLASIVAKTAPIRVLTSPTRELQTRQLSSAVAKKEFAPMPFGDKASKSQNGTKLSTQIGRVSDKLAEKRAKKIALKKSGGIMKNGKICAANLSGKASNFSQLNANLTTAKAEIHANSVEMVTKKSIKSCTSSDKNGEIVGGDANLGEIGANLERKCADEGANGGDELAGADRQFVCRFCNKDFRRPDILSRHLRLHTGERPFHCDVCLRYFSRSDHLRTHKRTHTDEKPYECVMCDYAARRRDVLTRHVGSRHRMKAPRTVLPRQRRATRKRKDADDATLAESAADGAHALFIAPGASASCALSTITTPSFLQLPSAGTPAKSTSRVGRPRKNAPIIAPISNNNENNNNNNNNHSNYHHHHLGNELIKQNDDDFVDVES